MAADDSNVIRDERLHSRDQAPFHAADIGDHCASGKPWRAGFEGVLKGIDRSGEHKEIRTRGSFRKVGGVAVDRLESDRLF